MRKLLCIAAMVAFATLALAQTERAMVVRDDMQSAGAITLDFGGPEDRPVVKNIPITADIVNTHVQYLPDGNKITNEDTSHFYRDSEGRTRRENKLMIPGRDGEAPSMISINDPVAHTRFILNTVRKSADELPTGAGREGDVMFFRKHADAPLVVNDNPDRQAETKEDLGTQTIEGVTAHGTRMSHTIPAGQIGNERPITVTTESWYSDDLGMEVLRIHKDPWSGEVTTKVTNVRRGEPDASLFTPPADYKVDKMNGRTVIQLDTKEGAPLPPPPPPQE